MQNVHRNDFHVAVIIQPLVFFYLGFASVLVLLPVKRVHRDAGSSVSIAFVHIFGAFCLCVGNRKANSVNSNLMSSLKTCL